MQTAVDQPHTGYALIAERTPPKPPRRSAARNDRRRAERLAKALGWFSVGLGLAEVLAPRQLARMIGADGTASAIWRRILPDTLLESWQHENTRTLRWFGLREIGTGLGIMSQRRPTGWVWARVAGDLVDLGFLASAMRAAGADRGRLTIAAAAVAGVTALDIACGRRLGERRSASRTVEQDGTLRLVHSIAVNRAPQDCYAFWRDLGNAPRFMSSVEQVTQLDDRRSHWQARGPGGVSLEWDAEITEDSAPHLLAWRSPRGAAVQCAGSVRFQPRPNGRGTLVRASMQYRVGSGGTLAETLAQLFGAAPDLQLREDLRRFKRLLETDTIITTAGQPAGPHRGVVSTVVRSMERRA